MAPHGELRTALSELFSHAAGDSTAWTSWVTSHGAACPLGREDLALEQHRLAEELAALFLAGCLR